MGEPDIVDVEDPVRERLLDAAVKVFARQGYDGARIMDIVREAGLSTGAVYGRFDSKEALLREAIIRRTRRSADRPEGVRVAEVITRLAAVSDAPLGDDEATRLEAYVAARRQPDLADALAETSRNWRAAMKPFLEAAQADGTVGEGIDPEAVLYFVSTLRMGLLVQRAAGFPTPDPAAWDALVDTIVSSFGTTTIRTRKGT